MPWVTPTLRQVRTLVRDDIVAAFSGAVSIGNSVLRVMSDANAGLAHLVLRYIDWVARQMLPDTAETEWLDRHGDIWLVNADNSTGRKAATFAVGTATFTGVASTVVPVGTLLEYAGTSVAYETTQQITLGALATSAPIRALDTGTIGNLDANTPLGLSSSIAGVDTTATVVSLSGGTDVESDDDLRSRVLFRIQQPPVGGDADDYVRWATNVAGVTRAWCSPLEMGMGTVTIRFMMDELRADYGGFPNADDVLTVETYLDQQRPVAVKDRFVVAPIPEPIDFSIANLTPDTVSVRSAIVTAVSDMLIDRAAPAHSINGRRQPATTVYASWVSDAIMSVASVESFTLIMDDHEMPHDGALAVMGTVVYG
jgi:uncharacterized phage protein gp47/JayE